MQSILTAKDVAKYLRMHVITVYRLAEQGKIPAFKVGRQWRFYREVIDEWARAAMLGRPARVLVVRPEGSGQMTLEQELRASKCNVTTATNASKAIAAAQANKYDAIVWDAAVPTSSLVTTLSQIRDLQPGTPLLLLTEDDDQSGIAEAAPMGQVTVLSKPLSLADVQALIGPLDRRDGIGG